MYPDISFTQNTDLSHLGFVRVEIIQPPKVTDFQRFSRGDNHQISSGLYRQTWVIEDIPLLEAKNIKAAQRKLARAEAIDAGFIYNGSRVHSNSESRILIQGAVQLAQLALADGGTEALSDFAASLNDGWRSVDGTVVATDAMGMVALGRALASHIATCDAVSQAHKVAINGATTVADVAAICVTSGYPNA